MSSSRFAFDIEPLAAQGFDGKPRQIKVVLPRTRTNMALLGDVDQVSSKERFNASAHTARIEVDGCTVLRGKAALEKTEFSKGGEWYHMVLTQHNAGWVERASKEMLHNAPVEFREVISPQMIRESWSWDKPVRMLPVQRDTQLVQNISGTVITPARVLTGEDYHPFIHLRTLMEAIIGPGYRIISSFLDTPMFRSLYISGAYPEQDTYSVKQGVNFRAGRFTDASAAADRHGTVRANPFSTLNSLGNIVETADPSELRGGVVAAGVFNTNDAFRIIDGRAAFVPLKEVQVGFEYNLRYRTPYTILSRTELSGFNAVFLGDGAAQEFKIVNRFRDRRGELMPGKNYLCIVFAHRNGDVYQLRYGQGSVLASFQAGSASVTLPAAPVTGLELWRKAAGEAEYSACAEDWALYDGYITPTGETDVEVCLRSSPEKVAPSSPKYFDSVYFEGGKEGDVLTLCRESYIRPIFSANPAMGSTVGFEDVAAHKVRQIEVIEAVAHMFNLRFHTDEYSRKVYIEPFGTPGGKTVDWSGLMDAGRPVTIAEPGNSLNRSTLYGYRAGDDPVEAFNNDNFTRFGEWEAQVGNSLARDRQGVSRNPLFTPAVSLAGGYPDAPSALLLQAGARDPYPVERNDSMNFLPKIVRYIGMAPLPQGEIWGWPSYSPKYPLAAFHYSDPEAGFTLCFEDRDGQAGLHAYYDPQYRSLNSGREITAWMRLPAADIETMDVPIAGHRDMGAPYRITVDGEEVLCRLVRIEGYDPQAAESVKCVFETI